MRYYNISVVTSASFATSERLTGFFLIEGDGKDRTGKKEGQESKPNTDSKHSKMQQSIRTYVT